MRHKPPRRRVMAKLRGDRSDATGPNQVWAMDWMHDELFDGDGFGFSPSSTRGAEPVRSCGSVDRQQP